MKFAKIVLDNGESFSGYIRQFQFLDSNTVIVSVNYADHLVDLNWDHVVSISYDRAPEIQTTRA